MATAGTINPVLKSQCFLPAVPAGGGWVFFCCKNALKQPHTSFCYKNLTENNPSLARMTIPPLATGPSLQQNVRFHLTDELSSTRKTKQNRSGSTTRMVSTKHVLFCRQKHTHPAHPLQVCPTLCCSSCDMLEVTAGVSAWQQHTQNTSRTVQPIPSPH